MTTAERYTLDNINEILFNGFNYSLPEETLKIISEIALQVGSPDYVKTPVFLKRENPLLPSKTTDNTDFTKSTDNYKKPRNKRGGTEMSNDEWDNINNIAFQVTKIEEKTGIESHIDTIRVFLNKLTDKNYIDMRNKIVEIIDVVIQDTTLNTEPNLARFSSVIFDIASTNRFYSKMYADLYSDLSIKYELLKSTFEKKLEKFTELFNVIEYVDPKTDYNRFCEINKTNEKRKALALFYLNLTMNGIIPKQLIVDITRNLLNQLYTFISMDDKKNEVDELGETVAILYKKELYEDFNGKDKKDVKDKSNKTKDKKNNENKLHYEKIDGFTIHEIVTKISKSKVKEYKSLTNKTIFKFMDIQIM